MDFSNLSNAELLDLLRKTYMSERTLVADVVAIMAEVERRHALNETSTPSLFEFCRKDLKMTADMAYRRKRAVSVAARYVSSYALLADGEITLTTIAMIEPYIDGRPSLLNEIRGKDTKEVEALLSRLHPEHRKPDVVRPVTLIVPAESKSPEPEDAPGLFESGPIQAVSAAMESVTTATGAELKFMVGDVFLQALEKVRASLWHKFPKGGLEDIFLSLMQEHLRRDDPARPRRKGAAREADPRARRPPAELERLVRVRDGDRCSYADSEANRCWETRGLQLDHILPWSAGGRSDDPDNLRLLCPQHNRGEWRRFAGLALREAPD